MLLLVGADRWSARGRISMADRCVDQRSTPTNSTWNLPGVGRCGWAAACWCGWG